MPSNNDLQTANRAKKDEFYTGYNDIQVEVNAYIEYNPDTFRGKTILLPCDDPQWSNFTRFFAQNFELYGIKKLISTCYAGGGKNLRINGELTCPDEEHGKVFILDHDTNKNGKIDIDDIEWGYLKGDGDFRSPEVTALRDEADIIITNPPFSLFREFLKWIMDANKKLLIIGNMNAITTRDVFPYFMENRLWLGQSIHSGDREFMVPADYPLEAAGFRVDEEGNKYIRVKGVRWFTNLPHGRLHQPMQLMSMADNIKYSSHKEVKNIGYATYDNFEAIEVPYSDAIPGDYEGIMGVPISFMDRYCPDQFTILGTEAELNIPKGRGYVNGKRLYSRIFIRKIK